jgi:hypothetical protein
MSKLRNAASGCAVGGPTARNPSSESLVRRLQTIHHGLRGETVDDIDWIVRIISRYE